MKGGGNMDNRITIAVIITAILIVGGFVMYNTGATVSAQGSGSVKVVPDLVSVNINVETRNSTAELANEQNKQISDQLLVELVKIGFDLNDLKFVNINSYPEYEYSVGSYYPESRVKGFVVSQQLVVKTSETSKVPKIVDAAINSGALVSYINFEISDAKQKELKAEAMTEASKDARMKAEAIASGQGKSLGRLVSLQNLDYGYGGPIRYFDAVTASAGSANMEAKALALDISPNEQDITANVAVTYKLGWF
jgi:uncharacterized protein YggE